MIQFAAFVPAATSADAAKPVPCAFDRHFGPFEPLEELTGWMGTDWFNCRACRSTLTRATVSSAKTAA